MDERTYSTPQTTRPGTAWVVVQYRNGEDAGLLTGVYHSDIDCPAVRVWAEAAYQGTRIIEVERASGDSISEWTQASVVAQANWQRAEVRDRTLDLSEWRACLRCGNVPQPTSVVCPTCFLTICDCDA